MCGLRVQESISGLSSWNSDPFERRAGVAFETVDPPISSSQLLSGLVAWPSFSFVSRGLGSGEAKEFSPNYGCAGGRRLIALIGVGKMKKSNRIGIVFVLLAIAGWVGSLDAQVVHEDIAVYATGAGSLVGLPEPGLNAVFKNDSICFPSACLYSTSNPGIITPSSGNGSYSEVAPGTGILMEIVEIDPAVSVRVGAMTLDAVGESADLGTASSLHIHPSYQVIVPEGQLGLYPVRFRFVADSGYLASPVYELLLRNQPVATPSPEPTPEPTPSPTPSPQIDCVGDRTYATAVADGCETITGGSLRIENTELANIDGLTMLGSVSADLIVENNSSLTNLEGLAGLTSVGGNVSVANNPVLCPSTVEDLLVGLTVGGSQSAVGNGGACGSVCDDGPPVGCDFCTSGAEAFKPLLKATNFSTGTAVDKLKYKAKLIFEDAVSINPQTQGFRLLVRDADAEVLVDLEIPPGLYDPVTRSGWIPTAGGKKFQYRTNTPLGGLVPKVILKWNPRKPGEVTAIVTGKSGVFAQPGVKLPLAATVWLDPTDPSTGLCAVAEFPGPKPQADCRLSGNGAAVICR